MLDRDKVIEIGIKLYDDFNALYHTDDGTSNKYDVKIDKSGIMKFIELFADRICESIPSVSGEEVVYVKTEDELCECGHERKHHGKSTSINYTEGKCRKCKCENFVIDNRSNFTKAKGILRNWLHIRTKDEERLAFALKEVDELYYNWVQQRLQSIPDSRIEGMADEYSKHPLTGKIDKVQRQHYKNGIKACLRELNK